MIINQLDIIKMTLSYHKRSVKVKDNLEAQDSANFLVNLECTLLYT